MRPMGELGHEGLPQAIPAEELQAMIGASSAFCSWDASNSPISDLTAGWPYLFSYPLMGADKKTKQ